MTVRYIDKYESLAGDISYTFSLANYEAQEELAFRTAYSLGIEADYAHDHLGLSRASKALATISIRATSVETSEANLEAEIDEAQSECENIGVGYLYRLESDGSTRRRCIARVEARPSITRGGFQSVHMPIIFRFSRLTDWYATSATSGSATVTTNPYMLSVTNAGNIWVKSGFVLTLTALTAAGLTNPSVRNYTTGQSVTSSRDSQVPYSSWKLDSGVGVSFSRATGLLIGSVTSWIGASGMGNRSYRNDNSLVTLGTQRGVLWLKPGVNQIEISVDGTPNYALAYSFNGAFV